MQTINIGTEINIQDLIQSRMLIQANSGGGKSALARTIIEKSFGVIPFIVLDKEGEYYTLKEKYGDVLVIGGQFADIPINLKSAKLLPKEIIGNKLSVIIDLSDFNTPDKRLYVKYFLEAMMHLTKEYWTGYLIFVEEAHFFCGEQDKFESGAAVKELMSTGRKRGYCGVLITQRISKLHKDAAAECNNKFIGRTFLDIDMDRSAKELGFSSSRDRLQLRDLQPGHFYAFGTSIEPHHVHEVTVIMPATKLPKAGADLHIQPKKPNDKIKSVLIKLNDLPAEAVKEFKNMQDLQQEVNRLKHELAKATKAGNCSVSEKDANQILKLKNDLSELQQQIKEMDKNILSWKKLAVGRGVLLTKIKNLAGDDVEIKPINETPKYGGISEVHILPSKSFTDHNNNFTKQVYDIVKNNNSSNGQLGKCSFSILQFLASFPERQFSKPQAGIATGYSPNSGGFNNSISELFQKGLIKRKGGKLQAAENLNGYDFEPQQYSIETFKNKLSKCEREIYTVLLDHPHDSFSKDELADATESKYSAGSGGFNNAISTLNTLELIKRESGMIRLNPELLEI